MLIIVNADDLGASKAVNEHIFDLMAEGIVRSATLITNGPAFDHAVAQIRNFPKCSFGVHLNLTAFQSVTESSELDPILTGGKLSHRIFKASLDRRLRQAVRRELMAQVQRAFDAGVKVTHFDSHHFVHNVPALFTTVKAVQRKFGIRKMRSAINYEPAAKRSAMWSLKKRVFTTALRKLYSTATPDVVCDFSNFHLGLAGRTLPKFKSLEIMVHPGHEGEFYAQETSLLRSDWRSALPPGAAIGSYYDL